MNVRYVVMNANVGTRMRSYSGGMSSTSARGCSWMKSNFARATSERASLSVPGERGRDDDGCHDEKHHVMVTRKSPFIIGVAGGTASGKTCLCKEIVKQLSPDAGKSLASSPTSMAAATQSTIVVGNKTIVNISQDCFYRDLTQEERLNISKYNFDHPSAFDVKETVATITKLRSGQEVRLPRYDFVTSSRRDDSMLISDADVILFDGILIFYWEELRDLFDLKIFVDTDADTRLSRRIRRDIIHRKRKIDTILDQYEGTVKPSFEQYCYPTKRFADVIVPRGAENKVAIELIVHQIKNKLSLSNRYSKSQLTPR